MLITGQIYRAINKINGKIYIGLTTETIGVRFKKHLRTIKSFVKRGKSLCLFHKAINKYGVEGFVIEEIDCAFSEQELLYLEKYWIKYYNSNNSKIGYNSTTGGEKYTFSPESIAKMSAVVKAKFASGERKPQEKSFLSRRVKCVESGTIYDSARQAALLLGKNQDAIARAARTGKTSCKMHWVFLDERKVDFNHKNKCKKGLLPPNSRKVLNKTTGEIYCSITEASLKNNICKYYLTSQFIKNSQIFINNNLLIKL